MTPWIAACQAPLSMGFPRQEYWSGLPLPSPGHLPDPEIKPTSLASPSLAGRFFTTEPPGRPVHSVGFDKRIMICTHHYSIIQNSFTALCAPIIHFSLSLNQWELLIFLQSIDLCILLLWIFNFIAFLSKIMVYLIMLIIYVETWICNFYKWFIHTFQSVFSNCWVQSLINHSCCSSF